MFDNAKQATQLPSKYKNYSLLQLEGDVFEGDQICCIESRNGVL